VEHRGDAVSDRLPVAVDQGDVDREIDARPRHHLPLKGVAMQIDDARKDQKPAGIDVEGGARRRAVHGADFAVGDLKRRFADLPAE